jgi:predicted transcriptional regulator
MTVAGRVEPELADRVRRLADAGNRTVSREVAEAIRRHVLLSEIPAERRVPDEPLPAVEALLPAGKETA